MSPHENQALKTRTQKSTMMADAHSLVPQSQVLN